MGKSTIASNLAVALAAAGANVGLVDADATGPNLPTMFGLPAGFQAAERAGPAPRRAASACKRDLARLPAAGRRPRRLARTDDRLGGAPAAARCRLGRDRLPANRPPARHQRRLDVDGPGSAHRRRRDRLHAPAGRARRRQQGGHDVREAQHPRLRHRRETCPGSSRPTPDERARDLRSRRRAPTAAGRPRDRLPRAKSRSPPKSAPAATTGRPIVEAFEPDQRRRAGLHRDRSRPRWPVKAAASRAAASAENSRSPTRRRPTAPRHHPPPARPRAAKTARAPSSDQKEETP